MLVLNLRPDPDLKIKNFWWVHNLGVMGMDLDVAMTANINMITDMNMDRDNPGHQSHGHKGGLVPRHGHGHGHRHRHGYGHNYSIVTDTVMKTGCT